LETQLGSRIESVTFEQVSDLVVIQVPEAFDLDFKSQLYGRADKDRRELAADVAALANTSGGLIVLGIEEDDP
jgi:predicted HTH transcriptional regulator